MAPTVPGELGSRHHRRLGCPPGQSGGNASGPPPTTGAFPQGSRAALPAVLGSPLTLAAARYYGTTETLMPVKIESFEPLSEEEFAVLRQQKGRKTDPAMVALLTEVAAGRPVRVPLVEGQSARGLRTAIARAASSRGLSVETLEGEGFVAVRQAEQPPVRKTTQSASGQGKRRGRPPKQQEQDAAEIASLRDLASGES